MHYGQENKSDSSSTHIAHLKPNVSAVAKTFDGSEMQDEKQINAVEGMKMYEDLFDDSEVGKMVSLVNDLRIAGRQRKFQGKLPTIFGSRLSKWCSYFSLKHNVP
ncbi:hypothetical protein L1987_05815 [Smallanthus sonchifolius]|uniref:Uncharacterized protein n=1 Tax=Smallanthus sonchifolius TaxID=185202 RepID=A0ACB9JWJ6_9ASTR|nr:hypothetical protein L1987_05815 [Smallanthus sonchifolius]